MKIVYSFGKRGYEAEQWEKEIRASSTTAAEFIPFNHDNYIQYEATTDAVQVDRLYQAHDARILRLQRALSEVVERTRPDVLFVTNSPPYHPEFLRGLPLYKVLYTTDDPGATYQRTIPYIHAYDHLMYCAPGYSPDCDLGEKLRYAGARRADWLPLGVFDFEMDHSATTTAERDVDVVYVGACYRQKLPIIAAMKRVFGRRVKIHGYFAPIKNAYLVLRYGYLGWIRPVDFAERTSLYRRSKIGFNIHWNGWGLGNQRLYHLPANAAMQICDCPQLLHHVFQPDREAVAYSNIEELIDRTRYYLQHDGERMSIAMAGHARVLREYRFQSVNKRIVELVSIGSGLSQDASQRRLR